MKSRIHEIYFHCFIQMCNLWTNFHGEEEYSISQILHWYNIAALQHKYICFSNMATSKFNKSLCYFWLSQADLLLHCLSF